jgi:hypothetical protein
MLLGRRAVIGFSLGCCIAVVSACGSSGTASSTVTGSPNTAGSSSQVSSPTSGAVSGGTHEFNATLQVSGAVTQSLNFSQPLTDLPACSTLAQSGFQGIWSIPEPNSETFYLNWNVTPYTGPGTYADASTYEGSVELDANGVEFDALPASVLSVTVKADGSGSATFQNLQDEYTGSSVDGSETWVCR